MFFPAKYLPIFAECMPTYMIILHTECVCLSVNSSWINSFLSMYLPTPLSYIFGVEVGVEWGLCARTESYTGLIHTAKKVVLDFRMVANQLQSAGKLGKSSKESKAIVISGRVPFLYKVSRMEDQHYLKNLSGRNILSLQVHQVSTLDISEFVFVHVCSMIILYNSLVL